MSTVTRQQYEAHRAEVLVATGQAVNAESARQKIEREYPKATKRAVEELRFRGLDATPWRIESYCRSPEYTPPVVGGSRIWTREAIDRLAEAMERDERLTVSATYRQQFGISWEEEQEMLRREKARKEAVHAGER